jgi:hypothetical protein
MTALETQSEVGAITEVVARLEHGRQAAERVKRGHEHGHGQRHGHGERDRQQEELADDVPAEPLSYQIAEPLGDVVEQQQRRERREGEHERTDMLFQDILVDYLHAKSAR